MEITYTNRFKKQIKKYQSNAKVIKRLTTITDIMISGERTFPISFRDHRLTGNMKQYRELHLFPDVLLVYEIDTEQELFTLAMIGSHSDLFG